MRSDKRPVSPTPWSHRLAAALAGAAVLAISACTTDSGSAGRTHPLVASVTALSTPGRPYGVAISRKGRTYVTIVGGHTLAVDATLPVDSLADSVAVCDQPPHVAFNPAGTRAYVVCQAGRKLVSVNPASGQALDSVALPDDGFNLITDQSGSQVFVSTASGMVYVTDAQASMILDSIALPPAVNGFARRPGTDFLYISSRDGGEVVEVNAVTHQVGRTFATGGRPQRLAVSPGGTELLIANEDLGLDIWNLISGTRDTSIALGAYGLGLSPDGAKVYVASGPTGQITIVDRHSRGIDTILTVGGVTRNVAFDRKGAVAVVTNEDGFLTVIE